MLVHLYPKPLLSIQVVHCPIHVLFTAFTILCKAYFYLSYNLMHASDATTKGGSVKELNCKLAINLLELYLR